MNKNMIITIFTIIFTIFAYFLQTKTLHATSIYGLNINFIKGFYWQPLTTIFIHGGLMHLGMNMIVLFQFGTIIEHARGKLYFTLLYFIGGIIASLLTFVYIYFMSPQSNVVGASGAICVLIGWIAQKDPFNRAGLIVAILLISFAPLLLGINIAWYGHIFGFIIGYFVAKIFK